MLKFETINALVAISKYQPCVYDIVPKRLYIGNNWTQFISTIQPAPMYVALTSNPGNFANDPYADDDICLPSINELIYDHQKCDYKYPILPNFGNNSIIKLTIKFGKSSYAYSLNAKDYDKMLETIINKFKYPAKKRQCTLEIDEESYYRNYYSKHETEAEFYVADVNDKRIYVQRKTGMFPLTDQVLKSYIGLKFVMIYDNDDTVVEDKNKLIALIKAAGSDNTFITLEPLFIR